MVRDDSNLDLLEGVGGGATRSSISPTCNSSHLASIVRVDIVGWQRGQTHGGDRGGEGENQAKSQDADVVFQAGVVELIMVPDAGDLQLPTCKNC